MELYGLRVRNWLVLSHLLHFSLSLTYNQTTRDRTLQNSRAADRRIKKAGEGRVGLNMYGCGYTTSKVTVMIVIL